MMSNSTNTPAAGRTRHIHDADRRLEEHRPALRAYCRSLVGVHDADDAVQETLLRAWRGLARFEGRSGLATWLHRIARNVCLDILDGRRKRAIPIALNPAPDAQFDTREDVVPVAMAAPEPSPADVVETREAARAAVAVAVTRLPPRQRGALILCDVVGLRAREAARRAGTSVASINSALQRARSTVATGAALEPGRRPDCHHATLSGSYLDAVAGNDVDTLVTLATREFSDAHVAECVEIATARRTADRSVPLRQAA